MRWPRPVGAQRRGVLLRAEARRGGTLGFEVAASGWRRDAGEAGDPIYRVAEA